MSPAPVYQASCGTERFTFTTLVELLAKANEEKSGDQIAGIAARSHRERIAAKIALANTRLSDFIDSPLIDPNSDEVSRLLLDTYDQQLFQQIASWTVGELRNWLLDDQNDSAALSSIGRAIIPEIAAAVAKLMSNMDLIFVASRIRNVSKLCSTLGESGVLGIRIQPNHPYDDVRGILLSTLEGLRFGCGDAVIGVNPAIDSVETVGHILQTLNRLIETTKIPTQACCLAHITTQLHVLEKGIGIDLLFQSIAGSEAANKSFGINLAMLREGQQAVLESHWRQPERYIGNNVMYFETGQGSALSSESHHGVDQLTLEARAYGVARTFAPFLVNSVVGFIGPEYLFDERQITRAGLEDHFMGKLLGLPMGCDVCYTNHAVADKNSTDNLMLLLASAGCNFFMGVPGSDDVMLNYQSTSYHDAALVRQLFHQAPTPEFAYWMKHSEFAANFLLPLDQQNNSLPLRTDSPLSHESPSISHRIIDDLLLQPNSLASFTPSRSVASNNNELSLAARLNLGTCGVGLPTEPLLMLREDHANAIDAVQRDIHVATDFEKTWVSKFNMIEVSSRCFNKREYLLRPDLGRQLREEATATILENCPKNATIQFLIGDGLSATAAIHQAPPLLERLIELSKDNNWTIGTPIFIRYCRVGILNDIGELLQPKIVILLIGERPGLATAESLSAYMAFSPKSGDTDANRNLVSNIHPQGVTTQQAAHRVISLATQMIAASTSGISIKEKSLTAFSTPAPIKATNIES
jgi:ethanolamine ammonia-lyase large subunit